jgi:hypothetical protein
MWKPDNRVAAAPVNLIETCLPKISVGFAEAEGAHHGVRCEAISRLDMRRRK